MKSMVLSSNEEWKYYECSKWVIDMFYTEIEHGAQ